MHNILVTGADGQLGRHIRLLGESSPHRYIFTDAAELDITDAAAVERTVEENGITAIINCAAYTDVDGAESNREAAEAVNVAGVKNLADAMRRADGLLVHISTDYVFDGANGGTPYTEEETPNPTGVYGLTKLRGERAVAESGCRHIIIRTSWLYSEYGRNFVRTMLALTAGKPQIKVVADQIGSPTYAGDLAAVIAGIVESGKWRGNEGTYNYSDEGACSWYDFAAAIAREAGHTACEILPCRSDEYPSKVTRPPYSVLDKRKIKSVFGIEVPEWQSSLKKCIWNLNR